MPPALPGFEVNPGMDFKANTKSARFQGRPLFLAEGLPNTGEIV